MSDLHERGAGDGREEAMSIQSPQPKQDTQPEGDKSTSVSSVAANEGVEPDLLGATGGAAGFDIPSDKISWPTSLESTGKNADNWCPDQELLEQLTSMGFNKDVAVKALYQTKNNSVEMAISWLFENPESELANVSDSQGDVCETPLADDPSSTYKMVFVVNSILGMKLGKTCAQVAHATLGLHHYMLQNQRLLGEDMDKWEKTGQAKIVLKGLDTRHLLNLWSIARDRELPCYIVQDAGRTQVPAGSYTVLAIFGRIDAVDEVTGSLKLL